MIKILTIPQIEYQKFWYDNNYHILQSYPWGNLKESEGWEVRRLGVFQNELLVDILSLQAKDIGGNKFAYIPKIKHFKYWEELKEYCTRELKLDLVIVEFELPYDHNLQLPPFFVPYKEHIQPPQTNTVPLQRSEEELFMGLKGNYRRNIKKAQKDNLICQFYTQGEDIAIDDFYKVLEQIFTNTKFLPRSKAYFKNMWRELSASGQITIVTAKMGTEILGSYLIVTDNLGAYELYGGVTVSGRDHEAGYLLKWESIKHFNELGKKFYDHWGVSKRLPDGTYQRDELYNISSFKEGFGGNYFEFYPAQVMIINSAKYNVFKILRSGEKVLTKIKKIFK